MSMVAGLNYEYALGKALPAADGASPYEMVYTPDMYLWNLGPQCTRSMFAGCGDIASAACSEPGATTVTWSMIEHCIPNHHPEIIVGQDLYNSYLHYHDYENHTVGLARILSCGG